MAENPSSETNVVRDVPMTLKQLIRELIISNFNKRVIYQGKFCSNLSICCHSPFYMTVIEYLGVLDHWSDIMRHLMVLP